MTYLSRVAFFLASVCLSFSALAVTPTQDAAYRFIVKRNLGVNLHAVSWSLVPFVDTHQKIVEAVGEAEAKRLIDAELLAVIPRHQEQWNRGMADAYAMFFTEQELKSFIASEQALKDAKNIDQRLMLVGHELLTLEPMVRLFVTDALANVYSRLKPRASTVPEQDAAYHFVVRQNIDKQLMAAAWMALINTKTYQGIKKELGNTPAQELVTRELEAVRPAYQEKWNRTVAGVYANHFTVAELNSLAADGKTSRSAGKLRDKQYVIVSELQDAASPLLSSFVTEGLTRARNAATKPRQR